MINELAQELMQEMQAFTEGPGSINSLNRAITLSHEIHEKLVILRFKAYEAGLFSQDVTNLELQEFDMDLALEKTEIEPVSTEAIFLETTDLPQNETANLPKVDITLEEPVQVTESIRISITPEKTSSENPIFIESFSDFNLDELLDQAQGKHPKINAFNGNYSLKEKINFINTLFGSSSESFGTAVKQIDGFKSLKETLPVLEFLSTTYNWHAANREILNKFLEKVMAKYA